MTRRQFKKAQPRSHDPTAESGLYCWSTQDALLVIRRLHEEGNAKFSLSGALALYYSFTSLAKKHFPATEFEVSADKLGRLAGVSERQVHKLLPILAEVGLICWMKTVTKAGGNGQCIYKLLSVGKQTPLHRMHIPPTAPGAATPYAP